MERTWWEQFVDSWARPGGSVLLLFLILLIFVPATVFIMIKWGPATPVAISMNSITSGFAGALAIALNPSNQGGNSRRTTDNGNGAHPPTGPQPTPGG